MKTGIGVSRLTGRAYVLDPDIQNDPPGEIMIVPIERFGSDMDPEQSVNSLLGVGLKALIAPSYSMKFRECASQASLFTVEVDANVLAAIIGAIKKHKLDQVKIDIEERKVMAGDPLGGYSQLQCYILQGDCERLVRGTWDFGKQLSS